MKSFIFCVSILLGHACTAQDDYLVTLKEDTVKGNIFILQSSFYDEVQVKNDEGKTVFKAYQIDHLKVGDDHYEPITYLNKKIIAQIIKKGKLSHYYIREENQPAFNTQLISKGDEVLVIGNIGFRKNLIEFLSDCSLITEQLENKEISAKELDYIVNTYNSECVDDKSVVLNTSDFSELKQLSQLLIDIISKVDKKEEVPDYLINALKKHSEASADLKIKSLINVIEDN